VANENCGGAQRGRQQCPESRQPRIKLLLHGLRGGSTRLVRQLLLAFPLRRVRLANAPLRPLAILRHLPDQLLLRALLSAGYALPPIPLSLQLRPQRLFPSHNRLPFHNSKDGVRRQDFRRNRPSLGCERNPRDGVPPPSANAWFYR
jgi:hypothetical protein